MTNAATIAQTKSILSTLHDTYPNLKHYIAFHNHVELLVATILSAQVRDDVVNATTPALFKKYPTARDFAHADVEELTKAIRNITFAGNKAKNIKAACAIIDERYRGVVPKTLDELTALPGIGRKSAHAILQNAFNIVDGIVVDTHVLRVSFRLGWTTTATNAEKAERELMAVIPRDEWVNIPKLCKAHGRAICKAPTPQCIMCPVRNMCSKNGVKT